jgi:exopolysaccharide biosynthesis WecB/TagA/CpsF family protein
MNDADIRSKKLLSHLYLVEKDELRKALLDRLSTTDKLVVLSFLNAHALTLATKDNAVYADLLASDYLFRDGVGISLLLRLINRAPGINMNGTDLTPQIIQVFRGKKVALCGTQDPWLSRAADVVRSMGCEVVLTMDGFQEIEAYSKAVAQSQADLVILAMGMPKQGAVAGSLAKHLTRPVVIVNGGAILDFMAKRFPRAPMLWRCLRLEWLFRIIHEPRRLAKRYIIDGIELFFLALHIIRSVR